MVSALVRGTKGLIRGQPRTRATIEATAVFKTWTELGSTDQVIVAIAAILAVAAVCVVLAYG
jgi:hypothetical protein